MVEPTELSEAQLNAARMIAMGLEFREIASNIGVSRTTVYRWRKSSQFLGEVDRLREIAQLETRNRVVRDINDINDIVLSTLLDVAQNDSSGSARVSAARALNEMTQRAEEHSSKKIIMQDQSTEIRMLLEQIQHERKM